MSSKSFHDICADAKANVKEITVKDVMALHEGDEPTTIIDVREDNEFYRGHIKGAIHVGRGILERDIHLHILSHDARVILYCGGGFRSVLAAESLQKMGYTNVI